MTPEEAKAHAAGDLGSEMAKYPLRFCKPAYFGNPPSLQHPIIVNNGTVSLLTFCDRYFAVTCFHVLEGYRRKIAEGLPCFFAIGNCHLDPLSQIVAEDNAIDVAVIELTPAQVIAIKRSDNGIGETFFKTNGIKPSPPKVGEFVAYGGFPGDLRQRVSFNELSFGSYSSGACRVTDLHTDYITCEFERAYWIKNFNEAEPESLGGLSGGPAFVIKHSPVGLISYEFAGIIFKMHEDTESLYIRHAGSIPFV